MLAVASLLVWFKAFEIPFLPYAFLWIATWKLKKEKNRVYVNFENHSINIPNIITPFISCLQCANLYVHGQLQVWDPSLLTETIAFMYLKSSRTLFALSLLILLGFAHGWIWLCGCSSSGNLIHLHMFCWGCELFWQQYIIYFIQWFSIFVPVEFCTAPIP